jgi:hypothetical protein
MSFKFVADTVLRGKAYPALAEWQAVPYTAEWRQFAHHWPYTVPCELLEHCNTHGIDYELQPVRKQLDGNCWYPVGLGFFNFEIDYFSLMPPDVMQALRQKNLRVLFYYHEGDNPHHIKTRLEALCQQHQLDSDCYRFVSGNTVANGLKNFVWFPDHELLYWHRNQEIAPTVIHTDPRSMEFTVLNRTHKWWRATAMTDLVCSGILDRSYWSYRTDVGIDDNFEDNPLEIDVLDLRDQLQTFVQGAPYTCDQLTSDQHNNHSLVVDEHFSNSYCSIVLETHFDADGSQGAFLTEKTFKCLKHGHPFVIAGGPGSLATLRDLGYRTFDHAIDNSYDLELDNTQRWIKLKQAIFNIQQQDMHKWFEKCLPDIKHNQQVFLASKKHRLNTLYDKLLHQLATT